MLCDNLDYGLTGVPLKQYSFPCNMYMNNVLNNPLNTSLNSSHVEVQVHPILNEDDDEELHLIISETITNTQPSTCSKQAATLNGVPGHHHRHHHTKHKRHHHHHHHHHHHNHTSKHATSRRTQDAVSPAKNLPRTNASTASAGNAASNLISQQNSTLDSDGIGTSSCSSSSYSSSSSSEEDDHGITFTASQSAEPCEVTCERLLPWEQAPSEEPVGISMPSGLHDNSTDITSTWNLAPEAPSEPQDIQPHDYGTKCHNDSDFTNLFTSSDVGVSSFMDHAEAVDSTDQVMDHVMDHVMEDEQAVDIMSCSITESESGVSSTSALSSSTDVATDNEPQNSESESLENNQESQCSPSDDESPNDSAVIPTSDELYEVTLTTGNIDKFRGLLGIKQQNSSSASLENIMNTPLPTPEESREDQQQEEHPKELPFPWLASCKNKSCKKFSVQPTSVADCSCDNSLNQSHSDSNMKSNNAILSKAFSSESRLLSPQRRASATKPNVLPIRSTSDPAQHDQHYDQHVIPFPWSSASSATQSSPVNIPQRTVSTLGTSASTSNLLPWEIPPSDPGCIRYGSLHSPSVSHDMDSICPQVSCQSMRLSEVESHISHHSEPFAHHHQVLDVPPRRATDHDLMLDQAPGVEVEFDLDNPDEDPRVDLYTRVMKWLEDSEAAIADDPEPILDVELSSSPHAAPIVLCAASGSTQNALASQAVEPHKVLSSDHHHNPRHVDSGCLVPPDKR